MNYDLFSQNFNNIKDFDIYFNKKLSQKEKQILLFLIKNEKNRKIQLNSLNELDNSIKYEEIAHTVEKISQKNIDFQFFKNNNKISGRIKFISCYFIEDSNLNIFLSQEFSDFINNYTIINKFDILSILSFSNKYSEDLFKYFQKINDDKNEIEVSVKDLKKILNINENYERFYDFNKNVLKPCCDDINKISHISIEYQLLKSGNFTNNKVVGVKFKVLNRKNRNLDKEVNSIFNLAKDKIVDFSKIKNVIEFYLLKYDFNYVKSNLIFSLNNYNGVFDDFFMSSLEENLIEFAQNSPIITIRKAIKNTYSLHSEIISIFKSIDNYGMVDHTVNNMAFIQKIYTLKEVDKIELKIGVFLISIKYNKNDYTEINLFKKINS